MSVWPGFQKVAPLSFKPLQRYPSLGQKSHRIRVRIVARIDNSHQAGVDDHLGAGQAGLVGYVEGAAVHADAVLSGLDDRVLLGVQRAHTVAVDHQMANVIAVPKACRRPVVSGRQDAPVFDDDRADRARSQVLRLATWKVIPMK